MTQITLTPPRADGQSSGVWQTTAAQQIMALARICCEMRDIGLVTGPSGAGKSTACEAAVEALQGAGRRAHYVTLTRASGTHQPGLLRLASRTGVWCEPNLGTAGIEERILQVWCDVRLVVIDEANFATVELLDGIRNLHDELGGVGYAPGILLVGTPDLKDTVHGRHKRRSASALANRIGQTAEIDLPGDNDFAAICAGLGVTGDKAITLIRAEGLRVGGMHRVRRLVSQARALSGGGSVTFDHLKTAAVMAGGAS